MLASISASGSRVTSGISASLTNNGRGCNSLVETPAGVSFFMDDSRVMRQSVSRVVPPLSSIVDERVVVGVAI